MNINLNKKAFTLIELLVVIAVVGILSFIGFTTFFNKKADLKKDVILLYNNLQFARIYAIKNKKEVTVTFYPDNNYYALQLEDNLTKKYYLSDSVEFGDGGHSSLSNHKVGFGNSNPPKETFTPIGFAKFMGSAYLKLKNSNNDVYQISVNLNGNITIKKWDGNAFSE